MHVDTMAIPCFNIPETWAVLAQDNVVERGIGGMASQQRQPWVCFPQAMVEDEASAPKAPKLNCNGEALLCPLPLYTPQFLRTRLLLKDGLWMLVYSKSFCSSDLLRMKDLCILGPVLCSLPVTCTMQKQLLALPHHLTDIGRICGLASSREQLDPNTIQR